MDSFLSEVKNIVPLKPRTGGQVLTDQNRAAGVQVLTPDKRSYVVKAKHIVLAASTFGTSQILLNSDLKGRAIGHYFTNHSRVKGVGSINRQEFPRG